MVSYDCCQIFKNNDFEEHMQTAASVSFPNGNFPHCCLEFLALNLVSIPNNLQKKDDTIFWKTMFSWSKYYEK